MHGNQRTTLGLSQGQRSNMAAYDRLPPALRRWLAGAALPWSPSSARRAWRRAMWKALGRERVALTIMDALEAERLARDALVQRREAEMAALRAPGGGEGRPPRAPRPAGTSDDRPGPARQPTRS